MKWQVNLVAYQVPSETQPFRSESAFSAFAGEGARATESGFEKFLYLSQDLRCTFRFVDRFAQGCSSGHAMREPGGELLHLAFGAGHFFFDEHLEIGADHFRSEEHTSELQ